MCPYISKDERAVDVCVECLIEGRNRSSGVCFEACSEFDSSYDDDDVS